MAFDAFMKFEGGPKVEGESKQKGFEKQIDIYSFSWGASNPSTVGQGGGGGAGKVSMSSFNVMKKTDLASAPLFQTCCSGDHFDKATVVLRKAGGAAQLDYLKYEFDEVYVDSIQWSGSTGGDDTPTESVSFSFGKVTITYKEQTPKGTGGGTTGGTWDIRTGTSK
jgi:type VI secretion system secreted protein Hcp